MKNILIAALFLLFATSAFTQIRFTSLEYANGLRYPKAAFPNEPHIADSVNKIIRSKIGDLEASDFCVGDFGYVQKGSHLQIHFMCNCIDMPATEHRYAFINLTTGTEVDFADIFNDKDRSKALSVIQKTITDKKGNVKSECLNGFESMGSTPNWDQLNFRLSKDGIELRPKMPNSCESSPILLPYSMLTDYFKYQFL